MMLCVFGISVNLKSDVFMSPFQIWKFQMNQPSNFQGIFVSFQEELLVDFRPPNLSGHGID